MLHSKMKKIGSIILLTTLFLTFIALGVTSHIYAEDTGSKSNIEMTQPVNEVKTEQTTVTEEFVIPHSIVEIPNDEMFNDESYVSVEGTTGLTRKTFEVRYENGAQVSKVLVHEEIITKPVDTIKYVGTKTRKIKTVAGTLTEKPANLGRYIDMTATAYDLSFESCGKRPGDRGYGITASGMKARVGVVAVDRRVIPLGTRLYIEAVDGSWVYGEAIAGDTGGAIKGNRIDLFFNTKAECMQFGKKAARVYILD